MIKNLWAEWVTHALSVFGAGRAASHVAFSLEVHRAHSGNTVARTSGERKYESRMCTRREQLHYFTPQRAILAFFNTTTYYFARWQDSNHVLSCSKATAQRNLMDECQIAKPSCSVVMCIECGLFVPNAGNLKSPIVQCAFKNRNPITRC